MTTPEAEETTDVALPADLSIGRVARGVIRDRLDEWGLSDDVSYRATIVATELASNALLHAAPPYLLRLSTDDQGLRIAVGDSLALSPSLRQYDVPALTGRGLQLVADYCTSWGVKGREGGKEVWADVPFVDDGQPSQTMQTAGLGPEPADAAAQPGGNRTFVRFLGVPVGAYLSLQEWNDAVVRECELIAALEPTPDQLPTRLLELAVRLSGRFAAEREGFRDVMSQARADGAATVDLEERRPAATDAAVAAADAFLEMMEELDGFCGTDNLLSEPPDPVVVSLRRWFVTEMRAQLLEHASPVPFRRPDDQPRV